jgi:hypothetical protein
LNIPDRPHAPERPKEGWCGECAVQQALLFHGAYFPQRAINRAGSPRNPDLYAQDIPVALKNLRVRFALGPSRAPLPDFLDWVRGRIRTGIPVFTGMKIHPTKHANWILDHFTLTVGCRGSALTVNTTWDKQVELTSDQLQSTAKGLSFANRHKRYFAIAILGPEKKREGEATVRIFVLDESKEKIALLLKAESLVPGVIYEVTRSFSLDREGFPFLSIGAKRESQAFHDTIPTGHPAVYRCRKRAPPPELGGINPAHFRSAARRLTSGKAIQSILESLEKEAGGAGDRAGEARAILQAVRKWVKAEPDRIRTLSNAKPAQALFQGRRLLPRIRGLSEEAPVQTLVKDLESRDDVKRLASVLEDLAKLRKSQTGAWDPERIARALRRLKERVKQIAEGGDGLSPVNEEARGLLESM